METTDTDGQLRLAKDAGQVHGTRKLVGLDTDQSDETAPAFLLYLLNDAFGVDPPGGFIEGMQAQIDVWPQDFAAAGILGQPVQTSQGIGRQGRAQPLDGVTIVIVVSPALS